MRFAVRFVGDTLRPVRTRPRTPTLLAGAALVSVLLVQHRSLAAAQVLGVAGSLVVNEVDYDQPGADTAEFVEIKNTTEAAIFLGDYDILGINGLTVPGTEYLRIELPNVVLGPGDYFVVGAASVPNVDLVQGSAGFVQNGAPDAVALVASEPSDPANDYLIDSVSYTGDTAGGPGSGGTWTESSGTGLSDSSSATSVGISRLPDGTDTDVNNVDLARSCISPGQANTSVGTGCDPQDPESTATATGEPPATATAAATATVTEPPTATATATEQPTVTATVAASATATQQPGTATEAPAATATPAGLAVELATFQAMRTSWGVRVVWTTVAEIDHAGFRVVRRSGRATARLTARLIPPRGGLLGGARYQLLDREAPAGPVAYWLVDVDTRGRATWHGPVRPPARKNAPLPGLGTTGRWPQ